MNQHFMALSRGRQYPYPVPTREGASAQFLMDGHDFLQVCMADITRTEATQFRKGRLKAGLIQDGPLILWLFQFANSVKGYDATDSEGIRYQVKGRRIHQRTKSRQLSAIRDLEGFDYLAAVLFDDDYKISRAALIPAITVKERSVYVGHTNSHKFMLKDSIWDVANVIDVTDRLLAVA